MPRDRLSGAAEVLRGVTRAKLSGRLDREPGRDVPLEWIVRRGLVGDEIEAHAPGGELGNDLRSIPEQPDRQGLPIVGRVANERDRLVDRVCGPVQVRGLEPALDA